MIYSQYKIIGGVILEKEFSIIKTTMDNDHPYYKANKSASQEAMATLSKSAFYLYYYFLQNDDGWVGTLRRTHVMKITGLSKSAYYRAMEELMDNGYLVDTKDGYEFYEDPADNEDEL